MNRYPRFALLLLVVLVFLIAMAPDPEAQAPPRYLEQLGDSSDEVRLQAMRELASMGEAGVAPLREAVLEGNLHARSAALNVLRELLIGYDEQASVAAEAALVELAQRGNDDVAYQSREVLATFSTRRIQATLEAIREMGVEIGHFPHLRLFRNSPFIVDFVIIDQRFEGTADEVAGLLARLPNLQVIYVDDAPIDTRSLREHRGILQSVAIRTRESACMGVRGQEHALGFRVEGTDPRSGAAAAGLVRGDIITSIEGASARFDSLLAELAQHRPGDSVELTVLRGLDNNFTVDVLLGSDFGGQPCSCDNWVATASAQR